MDDKLKSLVADIRSAVNKAERYADETSQEFSLEIAYGMGGEYCPKPKLSMQKIIDKIKSGVSDETERQKLRNMIEMHDEYIMRDQSLEDFARANENTDWGDSNSYDGREWGWRSSSSMC